MRKISSVPGMTSRRSYEDFLAMGRDVYEDFYLPYSRFKNLMNQLISECDDVKIDDFDESREHMEKISDEGFSSGRLAVEMYKKNRSWTMPLEQNPYFSRLYIGIGMRIIIGRVSEYRSSHQRI